jgi:hypothetical protein
MAEITTPDDYWSEARHHYYRDHDDTGAWGVKDGANGRVIATGFDKSVAAAVACLLNGDIALARSFLDRLPDRIALVPC